MVDKHIDLINTFKITELKLYNNIIKDYQNGILLKQYNNDNFIETMLEYYSKKSIVILDNSIKKFKDILEEFKNNNTLNDIFYNYDNGNTLLHTIIDLACGNNKHLIYLKCSDIPFKILMVIDYLGNVINETIINFINITLQYGIDINKTNNNRLTALMYAMKHEKYFFAKILLDNKADSKIKDLNNLTAYDYSKMYINSKCNMFINPPIKLTVHHELGVLSTMNLMNRI